MVHCLRQGLPDWAQLDHGLTVELIQPHATSWTYPED